VAWHEEGEVAQSTRELNQLPPLMYQPAYQLECTVFFFHNKTASVGFNTSRTGPIFACFLPTGFASAWCSGDSCLTESPGRGFEAASPQILREKGLSRFIPSLDPTHVGASSTESAHVAFTFSSLCKVQYVNT